MDTLRVGYWKGNREYHGILQYCCEIMRARIDSRVVGDRKYGRVFPVDGLAITGFNQDNTPMELPIRFCPECGKKIEVVYQ